MKDRSPTTYHRPTLLDRIVYRTVCSTFRVKAILNRGLTVIGGERVPQTGALLMVANHVSDLDPPLIGSITRRHVTFMAKHELWSSPVQAWVFNRCGCIPIKQGGSERRPLQMAIQALADDHAVMIFPEGARSRSGEMMPPRAGAGLIWAKSRARLLPIYIDGTYEARPIGESRTRPVHITVVVGTPREFPPDFPLASGGTRDYLRLSQFMMTRIAALKARLRDPVRE